MEKEWLNNEVKKITNFNGEYKFLCELLSNGNLMTYRQLFALIFNNINGKFENKAAQAFGAILQIYKDNYNTLPV